MKRSILATAILFLAINVIAAEPVKFVRFEYNEDGVEMTGTELERAEKTSTIKVTCKQAGAIGSDLFVMGVFLEIAKAKKCEYFVILKKWKADDGNWMHVGGFTNKKDADIKKEFGEQFSYTYESGQKREYYVVSELGSLAGLEPQIQPDSEEGFVSLFNGKDLSGWEYGPVPVSKKPISETLEGKTATKDGVFEVRDGLIVASGKRVAALYTAKQFNKGFQFKLEFRTKTDKPKDNSGIYIRGPQLQLDAVTEGGLTGVFKKLTKFKPGDWNEIEITVTGTEAICKCNGEVIGKPMTVPETGTIGLQSEYGEFEFRGVRIKELP